MFIHKPSVITLATMYAEQIEEVEVETFEIPAEFEELTDEELGQLHADAVEQFNAVYGDGKHLTNDDLETLGALTEGIERISAEISEREAQAAELASQAAELAARVNPAPEVEVEVEVEVAAEEVEEEEEEEPKPEVVTAAAPIRVPFRSRTVMPRKTDKAEAKTVRDVMSASADGLGVAVGTGIDFAQAGQMLDRRLSGFNRTQYEAARSAKRNLSEQFSLLTVNRPIADDLIIKSGDAEHVESVFAKALDQSRLKGGSLVAAGGWCAPSEVLYDILNENESRDGMLSLPEIGVARGGISFTTGPDFADLFKEIVGFSFTEEQDVAGEYAPNETPGEPNIVGAKPCYKIGCEEFQEYRLDVDGLCISAGLLQYRGYPELHARVIRGALVAHDHRIDGNKIAQIVNGSTAITMPATQAGAAAPLLTAVELQVEHYRAVRRLSRSFTVELVLPFWARGVIRTDLSRRLGVDLINVTDAMIDGWFRQRNAVPQYVYNWQDIGAGAATAFTAWPGEIKFLIYGAGTWVAGHSEVITLDTLYDAQMLANNDFTALFTEEGWFVAKRGHDSRVVTVTLSADGATHTGVDIAHDGTIAAGA